MMCAAPGGAKILPAALLAFSGTAGSRSSSFGRRTVPSLASGWRPDAAAGMLPAEVAYVGALIVDAVVAASSAQRRSRCTASLTAHALLLVAMEGLLVAALAGAQRGISLCQSLLRAQLGQRVNVMILEKALTLELAHFEDSEFYDKLTRARREASSRPLRLVHARPSGSRRTPSRSSSYGALLAALLAVGGAVLVARGAARVPRRGASSPATRSGCSAGARPRRACRSTSRRCSRARTTPRKSSSSASGRCSSSAIATSSASSIGEDRDLTIRRGAWGFVLGLLGDGGVLRRLRLDRARDDRRRASRSAQMTMYLMRVQAGAVGVSRDPRRDRRHVRGQPLPVDPLRVPRARRSSAPRGRRRRAGPTRTTASASRTCSFTLSRARAAGARRTSTCTSGPAEARARRRERLRQDHADQAADAPLRADRGPHHCSTASTSREWDEAALRRRIGVIFQDFVRYQLIVGENIGAGDVTRLRRRSALARRRREGHGDAVHREAARAATTRQLGSWFNGRAASSRAGSGRRSRSSRAFMRTRRRHPGARRADRGDGRRGRGRRSSSTSAR